MARNGTFYETECYSKNIEAFRGQYKSLTKKYILMKCNLSKTLLSVFHITYYLYRLKISTFYSIQRRNSDKNANFFAWEKDRMMSVGSNFLCGCPHGADELISPRPHVSTRVWPLLPPCGRHKWMAPLTKKCISTKWNMILIDAFDEPERRSSPFHFELWVQW